MSPAFSISTSTWPASAHMLETVFSHSSEISKIERCDSIINNMEGGKQSLQLRYYFADRDTAEESSVVLDSDGKILYLDYFDKLYGLDRYRTSVLVDEIPFEFVDNKIILSIQLNENSRVLRLLFDTGSDGMAVDKLLADSLGLVITRQQSASMVGGNLNISISSGNTVHVGDKAILKNRNIGVFEYDHGGLDGILGLTLANNYIVNVDFDRSVIGLYSFGDFHYEKDAKIVPIKSSGVALIPGRLNLTGESEVDGNFIFDTGAGFNLVCFEDFVRKNRLLLSGFKYESVGSMAGIGHNTAIYNGKATTFSMGDGVVLKKQMPVTLQASNGKGNWNMKESGSLGIKFIANYNFTINLVDKVIAFQERNSLSFNPRK
ncbi:MAG: retropepsin-like aspartic protease [Draconibacterium sp.]